MTWTRAQYVAYARQEADAENSARWSDPDIVTRLGLVHRREWKALLDAAPTTTAAEIVVTPDAAAQVSLASLSTGTGDAQQLLYKIRKVRSGSGPYRLVDPLDWSGTPTGGTGMWWRAGKTLRFLAGDVGQTITVEVNYLPTPADLLSGDGVAVEWPDGHELVLAYETAALMLAKGGAETQQAADLRALAAEARDRMYHDLARPSGRPTEWRYSDSASDWGA